MLHRPERPVYPGSIQGQNRAIIESIMGQIGSNRVKYGQRVRRQGQIGSNEAMYPGGTPWRTPLAYYRVTLEVPHPVLPECYSVWRYPIPYWPGVYEGRYPHPVLPGCMRVGTPILYYQGVYQGGYPHPVLLVWYPRYPPSRTTDCVCRRYPHGVLTVCAGGTPMPYY